MTCILFSYSVFRWKSYKVFYYLESGPGGSGKSGICLLAINFEEKKREREKGNIRIY
jgi:hypothetical protein